MTKFETRPAFGELGEIKFEDTNCPVCGSDKRVPKYEKTVKGYHLNYVICDECETLYQKPRMTVESLRMIYASKDFYEGGDDSVNYYSFLEGEPYLSKTAQRRIDIIKKFAKGRKLLEVASAAGFFLKTAKANGFDVQGVEFSRPMAEWASTQWGVPITADSIELVELQDAAFDVIASWGVFTILRDPRAAIRKFHKALKPEGVFALNTYYHPNLWADFFKGNWLILAINMSQIYTKKTLRSMLESEGFEVVSVRRDRPYAGIKYILFHTLSHFPGFVKRSVFDRITWMNKLIVPVYAPDNLEWICVKKKQ
jgi:2-polyprenyl-3-methyl-5-hydroxy-6-metoxy-1,4-benzoquinol methylase